MDAPDIHLYEEVYRTWRADADFGRGDDYVDITGADFSGVQQAVRLIAFYLPQFHPIPENDHWWGKGFTEWTNVSKAVPRFAGQYQPRLPGELGFYDLTTPGVQRRQVDLAKKYGIYGFCFYYYWFEGRRILERPLDQFMADPEIDFPFCVCWANENWTRRWDGSDEQILLDQNHSVTSDSRLIEDVSELFSHPRYIKIDSRPLLMVYRPTLLADAAAAADAWRRYCAINGIENPYLVAIQCVTEVDPRQIGFDAAAEFPPNTPFVRMSIADRVELVDPDFEGSVFDYRDMAEAMVYRTRPEYPLFKAIAPAWDNTARRAKNPIVFANSTPERYRRWLDHVLRVAARDPDPEKRVAFVNAWNEWGESAYLEPDRRYGYAYLQSTADALSQITQDLAGQPWNWKLLFCVSSEATPAERREIVETIRWLQNTTAIVVRVLVEGDGRFITELESLTSVMKWRYLSDWPVDKFRGFVEDECGGRPDLVCVSSTVSPELVDRIASLNAPIEASVIGEWCASGEGGEISETSGSFLDAPALDEKSGTQRLVALRKSADRAPAASALLLPESAEELQVMLDWVSHQSFKDLEIVAVVADSPSADLIREAEIPTDVAIVDDSSPASRPQALSMAVEKAKGHALWVVDHRGFPGASFLKDATRIMADQQVRGVISSIPPASHIASLTPYFRGAHARPVSPDGWIRGVRVRGWALLVLGGMAIRDKVEKGAGIVFRSDDREALLDLLAGASHFCSWPVVVVAASRGDIVYLCTTDSDGGLEYLSRGSTEDDFARYFGDMALVHRWAVESLTLTTDFLVEWESTIPEARKALVPSMSDEEFEALYPLSAIRLAIWENVCGERPTPVSGVK